jgi:L-rhamnose mutarotase
MRTAVPWISVLFLLACGSALGFSLAIAVTRPAAVSAGDALAVAADGSVAQTVARTSPPQHVQRFGSMIGLRPEKKAEYLRLHASCWPEVLAVLKKCHIQNYSIYLGQLDGRLYLFSYFEYVGQDIAKDVAIMKADAKTREWWTHTDPCQIRLPDTKAGDWWKGIPEVFHMD